MSDTYVLIKEYPGSPKLGTIAHKEEMWYRYASAMISKKAVENYPEFWQLQEEVKFTERDVKSFVQHCIINSKSTLDDAFRVWKAAHGHK